MALAEMVAAAPDSVHQTGEQLRALGGSFKGDIPQDKHVSEDKAADTAQLQRLDGAVEAGLSIPVLAAAYDGGMGCDARHLYNGMLSENGQSMYYAPGYEFPQPSSYCAQPQGPYISNMGSGATGYCGAQYGPYYQQVSPGLLQYYPLEQEVCKSGSKKLGSKDTSQNMKSKPGAQGKPGYQVGHKNSVQSDTPPNHWGPYSAAANGGFYGAAMGYDCYLPQQWQSSARGFQPVPAPQNIVGHGNCVPPLSGGGPGRYQNFPRVQSTPSMTGKVVKWCSVKGGPTGSNWRAKEGNKNQIKCEGGPANNGVMEACFEQTQKPSGKSRLLPGAVQDSGNNHDHPYLMYENQSSSVYRADYNKENFQISYETAKFFIIKSYSEDDVHKSIKYGVWSSTPNGNKRLDEAYRKAQEKLETALCPVFFFFSVNCSGQFCGVAEMVGSVDFGKNMDFWLQGKWNGCLPVKWHIIKDVPNGHFRHIILSNNDNKPVTHSRDTQEVHFHQGLEMLKIFKFFPIRTSLLDDFAFYDGRQRVLQERKSRQQLRQQVVKQIKERVLPDRTGSVSDVPPDPVKENGRSVNVAERLSNGVDLSLNASKENGRAIEVESEKPCVDCALSRAVELKVDGRAESNVLEESCPKDREKPHVESVSAVEEDKSSKPNASKDECTRKENSGGKETNVKSEVSENGGDKNSSRLKVTSTDTLASSGKEDPSRVVINYKKALLEGIRGKVIPLDQTIGA